jgi:hypothetical protein
VLGSARLTLDLDMVYSRTADNLDRLADSLAPVCRRFATALRVPISEAEEKVQNLRIAGDC